MLTVNAVEVQKHQLRGPVGYTVVGSPAIVDGVVSGFSTSNYLTFSSSPSFSNPTEIVIKAKFDTFESNSVLLGWVASGSWSCFLQVLTTGKIGCYFQRTTSSQNDSRSVWGNFVLSLNTWYWLKLVKTDTTLSLYYSTDGINYNSDTTATFDSMPSFSVSFVRLGCGGGYNPSSPTLGSIDLNETYIKVNGKLWFYQPADTKYIVKDGKLVWADPRLALSGPVGYEVVGSPTIVDGVASGFSSSSYLQISQTYNATNNKNVEIYVRAKMPTTFPSDFNPILNDASYPGYWGISSYTSGMFTIRMGHSDSKTLQFKDMYIRGGIQPDTWYRFKITGNNGIWRAEIYSDSGTLLNSDDKDWTSNTVNANHALRIRCTDSTGKYSGSIDLNETYIKVNDQLWFYGKNYATQNIAPVPAGYTFGTTTTPSIGYVDMRTQEFTAAPQGATIGRDE